MFPILTFLKNILPYLVAVHELITLPEALEFNYFNKSQSFLVIILFRVLPQVAFGFHHHFRDFLSFEY